MNKIDRAIISILGFESAGIEMAPRDAPSKKTGKVASAGAESEALWWARQEDKALLSDRIFVNAAQESSIHARVARMLDIRTEYEARCSAQIAPFHSKLRAPFLTTHAGTKGALVERNPGPMNDMLMRDQSALLGHIDASAIPRASLGSKASHPVSLSGDELSRSLLLLGSQRTLFCCSIPNRAQEHDNSYACHAHALDFATRSGTLSSSLFSIAAQEHRVSRTSPSSTTHAFAFTHFFLSIGADGNDENRKGDCEHAKDAYPLYAPDPMELESQRSFPNETVVDGRKRQQHEQHDGREDTCIGIWIPISIFYGMEAAVHFKGLKGWRSEKCTRSAVNLNDDNYGGRRDFSAEMMMDILEEVLLWSQGLPPHRGLSQDCVSQLREVRRVLTEHETTTFLLLLLQERASREGGAELDGSDKRGISILAEQVELHSGLGRFCDADECRHCRCAVNQTQSAQQYALLWKDNAEKCIAGLKMRCPACFGDRSETKQWLAEHRAKTLGQNASLARFFCTSSSSSAMMIPLQTLDSSSMRSDGLESVQEEVRHCAIPKVEDVAKSGLPSKGSRRTWIEVAGERWSFGLEWRSVAKVLQRNDILAPASHRTPAPSNRAIIPIDSTISDSEMSDAILPMIMTECPPLNRFHRTDILRKGLDRPVETAQQRQQYLQQQQQHQEMPPFSSKQVSRSICDWLDFNESLVFHSSHEEEDARSYHPNNETVVEATYHESDLLPWYVQLFFSCDQKELPESYLVAHASRMLPAFFHLLGKEVPEWNRREVISIQTSTVVGDGSGLMGSDGLPKGSGSGASCAEKRGVRYRCNLSSCSIRLQRIVFAHVLGLTNEPRLRDEATQGSRGPSDAAVILGQCLSDPLLFLSQTLSPRMIGDEDIPYSVFRRIVANERRIRAQLYDALLATLPHSSNILPSLLGYMPHPRDDLFALCVETARILIHVLPLSFLSPLVANDHPTGIYCTQIASLTALRKIAQQSVEVRAEESAKMAALSYEKNAEMRAVFSRSEMRPQREWIAELEFHAEDLVRISRALFHEWFSFLQSEATLVQRDGKLSSRIASPHKEAPRTSVVQHPETASSRQSPPSFSPPKVISALLEQLVSQVSRMHAHTCPAFSVSASSQMAASLVIRIYHALHRVKCETQKCAHLFTAFSSLPLPSQSYRGRTNPECESTPHHSILLGKCVPASNDGSDHSQLPSKPTVKGVAVIPSALSDRFVAECKLATSPAIHSGRTHVTAANASGLDQKRERHLSESLRHLITLCRSSRTAKLSS